MFGKILINIEELGVDVFLVFSYKVYGFKGVGVVYIWLNVFWKFVYFFIIYEYGFRVGIVNVFGIGVFIVVVELIISEMDK